MFEHPIFLLLLHHDEPALVQLSSPPLSVFLPTLLSCKVESTPHSHNMVTPSIMHGPSGILNCHFSKNLAGGQLETEDEATSEIPHYLKCPHPDKLCGRARAGDAASAGAREQISHPVSSQKTKKRTLHGLIRKRSTSSKSIMSFSGNCIFPSYNFAHLEFCRFVILIIFLHAHGSPS